MMKYSAPTIVMMRMTSKVIQPRLTYARAGQPRRCEHVDPDQGEYRRLGRTSRIAPAASSGHAWARWGRPDA